MKHDLRTRIIPRFRLLPVIGIALFCYFSWHLVQGERSYVRLIGLENRIEQVRADYRRVHTRRKALEKRVTMLRPGKINRDLLTERVRKQLGYRYEGERELLMSDLDSLGSAS
jgi:cell division protein FtsB